MTDEESKIIEETRNFSVVPKLEVEDAVIKRIRWGFVPDAIRSIAHKSKEEIYNALDYWYGLNEKLPREDFAKNIILYGEEAHLLKPEQISVVREWADDELSPIERKALKSEKLRLYFGDDLELLKRYIKYCVATPHEMAQSAVTMNIDYVYRKKPLYDELKRIGLNVGNYEAWRKNVQRKENKAV